MILYQLSLMIYLLVFHQCLTLPIEGISDTVRPFELKVTPSHVNRYTAKNMTLRCDRNLDIQTEVVQIFRMRILKKIKTKWNLVAEKRDLMDRPTVELEGNLTASASIEGEVSNAFLQVSWDIVKNDSFGVFMCEVLGFDIRNNAVTERSFEVEIHEGKNFIEYFVTFSKEVKDTVLELKEVTDTEIQHLKKGLKDLEKTVASLEPNQTSLQNRLASVETNQSAIQSSLASIETRLERSIAEKTDPSSVQGRLKTVETFLSSLTQWPGGSYALLQPKTGCPVDLAFFGGTHKFQKIHTESQVTTEINSHSQALSDMTTFAIGSKRFVTMEMCEVTKQFNTASWPRGSFCIHKLIHQPCPARFESGSVLFDTEDDDRTGDARNNVAVGVNHPTLYFCCQDSDSASTPVRLPKSSSFLLYRRGGVCQAVQGMAVSEEFLQFNTEDSDVNDNVVSGSHPDIDQPGTVIKFHLCYYTKL